MRTPTGLRAAWTDDSGSPYPAYVQITRNDDGSTSVTVRGQGRDGGEGKIVTATMPRADWETFLGALS